MSKKFAEYAKTVDPRFGSVMERIGKGLPDVSPTFPDVWRAIVEVESGGNADAIGDAGRSFGYLQLNTAGGQGAGHSPTFLLQPANNAGLGGPPIAAAYRAGAEQGLRGMALLNYTAIHSGHPVSDGNAEIPGVQGYLRVLDVAAGYVDAKTGDPLPEEQPEAPAAKPAEARLLGSVHVPVLPTPEEQVARVMPTPAPKPDELVTWSQLRDLLLRIATHEHMAPL